jgi:hypothetical protein
MNAPRIFERKIVRTIYRLVKGERRRIRKNKAIMHLLQVEDIVKLIKSLRLRWYGHVERIQNQRISKQIIATTIMEGTRKRGRQRRRGRREFKYNGI